MVLRVLALRRHRTKAEDSGNDNDDDDDDGGGRGGRDGRRLALISGRRGASGRLLRRRSRFEPRDHLRAGHEVPRLTGGVTARKPWGPRFARLKVVWRMIP